MSEKLNFWKWLPKNGNIVIFPLCIIAFFGILYGGAFDYSSDDPIDWDNPQWVKWAVLFFPLVIMIAKGISTWVHWKEIR